MQEEIACLWKQFAIIVKKKGKKENVMLEKGEKWLKKNKNHKIENNGISFLG